MNRPAGCAEPDFTVRVRALPQFKQEPKRTGATRGLQSGIAFSHRDVAKGQFCHGIDETDVTFRPQIGFAALQFNKHGFSGFDGGHHRGLPGGIPINADAEINFVGPRVSLEQ